MQTIGIGIKKRTVAAAALTEWNVVLAMAMLPPVAVVAAAALVRDGPGGGGKMTFHCHGARGVEPGRSL